MSTIQKVESKETEMISPINHTTMPSKKLPIEYIISNIQLSVITDPIDPKRISKESTNSLTMSSAVKAGLVFFGTLGVYYLTKTTNILSCFGWGAKNSDSKNIGSSEIAKVKNRENAMSVGTNLETARQGVNSPSVNQIVQAYKDEDRRVKFEGMKVEEFKNSPKVKEENVGMRRSDGRRSISVQNPIPDQKATVRKIFELTIDGNNVFNSSSALSLEATNIPPWLTSISIINPTFKGSYDTPGRACGVTLSGNYAYVGAGDFGLQIVDISDPSNPTFKGSYDTLNYAYGGVVLFGNYAYVEVGGDWDGLQIIDVSDPSNPTFKGSYNTPYWGVEVALSENYAFVLTHDGCLQIINVTDPSNPTFKSSYNVPYRAHGIAVSGNYAYVANNRWGLQIIDISDPANPTFKGLYDTPDRACEVAVFGNYAYVADRDSGLQIIDINNPSNPTFKGSYDTPDRAYDVVVFGNYAYVADWDSGLQIIDISDPSNPTFEGSYDTPGNAYGIALSGNYAYVADRDSGLQIIALNMDKTGKLIFFGTPSSLGTYSVDIEACNEEVECLTDSFDIIVGNKAPIVANPLQNQTAAINTLFNYIFPTNTFIDPDGHSLTYTAKSSNNEPLPSWLNFNSPQREFFGTPNAFTTYSIEVIANDNYGGNISNAFNVQVINNAPIVANQIQNQTAIINTLFNYVFSTNTFVDPDGHSLTYIAKLLNNEPLPSWLNFNSPQRKFSGVPNTLTTYSIKVIANDDYDGSVSTMFNLIVKAKENLATATIISAMMAVVCIASFCILPLIIGGGIIAVRQRRNKILENENDVDAKELQRLDTSDDKKIIVDNELPKSMEEQKKPDNVNKDVELDAIPYFRED
jgi:hypothetical protein